MDNLPWGADNKFAPFNRKEKYIKVTSSMTLYRDYKIMVYEDEWEEMSKEEQTRYIIDELNEYKTDEDEVLEDYEEE